MNNYSHENLTNQELLNVIYSTDVVEYGIASIDASVYVSASLELINRFERLIEDDPELGDAK